jgi:hypothetical protein
MMTLDVFTIRMLEESSWLVARSDWLRGASRASLTALAGLAAIGRPLPAAAASCCHGPASSGSCAINNCSGSTCQGQCGFVTGFCTDPNSPCWSSADCPPQTCCDCSCFDGTRSFYCYCVGF